MDATDCSTPGQPPSTLPPSQIRGSRRVRRRRARAQAAEEQRAARANESVEAATARREREASELAASLFMSIRARERRSGNGRRGRDRDVGVDLDAEGHRRRRGGRVRSADGAFAMVDDDEGMRGRRLGRRQTRTRRSGGCGRTDRTFYTTRVTTGFEPATISPRPGASAAVVAGVPEAEARSRPSAVIAAVGRLRGSVSIAPAAAVASPRRPEGPIAPKSIVHTHRRRTEHEHDRRDRRRRWLYGEIGVGGGPSRLGPERRKPRRCGRSRRPRLTSVLVRGVLRVLLRARRARDRAFKPTPSTPWRARWKGWTLAGADGQHSCTPRRVRLDPMPRRLRAKAHALAATYGATSCSYGDEPRRRVDYFRAKTRSFRACGCPTAPRSVAEGERTVADLSLGGLNRRSHGGTRSLGPAPDSVWFPGYTEHHSRGRWSRLEVRFTDFNDVHVALAAVREPTERGECACELVARAAARVGGRAGRIGSVERGHGPRGSLLETFQIRISGR